jgi:hypothetical protein
MDVIQNFGPDEVVAKGLFTQFYRNKDSLISIHDMLATSGVPVYDSVIRRCSAVDHSLRVRRPLAKCASRSLAAQDYGEFTSEYLSAFKEVEEDGIA